MTRAEQMRVIIDGHKRQKTSSSRWGYSMALLRWNKAIEGSIMFSRKAILGDIRHYRNMMFFSSLP